MAGAILAAVALAACGAKKDALAPAAAQTQPLNLMLDWLPNADHVGIYEALANGDFTQAGLSVHVQVPTDPATPLQLLAAGKVDAAISYEPQLMLARDAGEPLVAIAALVQRPAHLDRGAALQAHHHAAGPARQEDRRRRHPVPAAPT